jgi:putative nucleotidyltransferase with HDIG domain
MQSIAVVSSSRGRLAALRSLLSAHFEANYVDLEDLPSIKPGQVTILDIDLRQTLQVHAIKIWLAARPANAQVLVGIDDKASYLEVTQACAIGATSVISRPFDGARLHRALTDPISHTSAHDADFDPASELGALQMMFTTAGKGRAPNVTAVKRAGAQIIDKIRDVGLAEYLDVIRRHHVQTYQHCLVVTAVAIAFGSHLGFNRDDIEKLALAGLLHDVGKAKIPLDILEKPTALDEQEASTMQMHPTLGHEILRHAASVPYEILDMVLHHHELLDGSGYPHGLRGTEITDLTRMMTISDIYGALIERRAYRPPISGTDAFQILQTMGDKLDVPLVKSFAPLACGVRI